MYLSIGKTDGLILRIVLVTFFKCLKGFKMENSERHLYVNESEDIKIHVRPFYVEDKSDPESGIYFYAYRVSMRNDSTQSLKLIRRHWIIKNGDGKVDVVNGEGVVGQRPTLAPGDTFNYTSFCVLQTPTGNMRGRYQFEDTEGRLHWVDIPLFFLRKPETFH